MTTNPFVILYVEDDAYIRESFVEIFATPERPIVGVADCAGARDALRERDINLLITDISLPDGSGLDLAREALRKTPAMPVIVCSGYDATGDARSLGPTAHAMTKPVDLDELEALVERLAR